jgi:ADP-ribosylglycohydrolase
MSDRTVGCFKGIATGDAIGKQTENLSREDVLRWYPRGISGFEGTPNAVIPRYARNSKRVWRFGETTDDTERTLAVARAVIRDHQVSHVGVGQELLNCTKCVHPGVRSLWEFHQAGDPARTAVMHDGCGAASRVAPVGVFYLPVHLDRLVDGAREASIPTHGGPLAIAAAAATAAAVSAAIDGASPGQVREFAERAAMLAEARWSSGDGPSLATAIRVVHDDLASLPDLDADAVATHCFPNCPLTIVPLALGLATVMRSATEAILLAANVGGDSDSVASIAGGILGAAYPTTINQDWFEVVERVNGDNVAALAQELAGLRH